ncbi:MAG: hypothetical protein LBK58_08870 [Prevotellaceae bacterium]|jgi:hypothetical protein|nr:hypothetical protein [Prevotellaceae bacterium]
MKSYVAYIFILIYIPLSAQTYASHKLAEIGEYVSGICLPAKDSIFDCPEIIRGKSLTVKYNSKNEVAHLGISLFSQEAKEMINFPVCSFIERFLLELLQQKTAAGMSRKLEEYGVNLEEKKLTGNSSLSPAALSNILNRMQMSTHFTLVQTEKKYTAIWKPDAYGTFEMTFPVSRELIFGTNKKESDEALSELLPASYCSESQKRIIDFNVDEMSVNPHNSRIFERKGDSFILPRLNSDICCFRNSEGKFQPVYDADYPGVSLKNLFLLPYMNTSLQLHIKHRQYSNFTPEFEMKLSDFICFFQAESSIYCHVETANQDMLNVYVIVYSKKFNYIHMLNVKTDTDTVFKDRGMLQAEFYSNIPQHNIKNLFSTVN